MPYLTSLPGSPAERAGLLPGDIVIRVNGLPTPNPDAFMKARREVEGSARVTFVRDGAEHEVELTW